jgi:hypothetical protein
MTQATITCSALDTPVEGLLVTDAGSYQASYDLSALVAGDEVVIRAFRKIGAGSNKYFATVRINYDTDIDGNPDADQIYTPPPWAIEDGMTLGLEITMTDQTTALPRAFPCTMTSLATYT